ncbi:AAA family ATPase [Nocardia cyriacigeorgica]|uniref:AAA family ATPase n=1 Tax=Nocardia cyriacigeorgica TaxID=135487 RepID=UPI002454C893|nr:AAA family ATPase [Nocardia cyriacigeorgica]
MTALQLVPNNGDRWVLDTILGPPGDGAFATSVGRKPGTADFYPNTSEGRDAFVHTLQGARDRKQNVFISSAIWAESTLDLKDPTLGRDTAPFLRSHCLWVDIDSPSQMNWALLNRLKRRAHMITHSGGVDGGRNRLHVRPLLAEPITDGHEFDVLNKWAAHALRGDNKWSQHTWLTMPGTTRYKEDEYPDGRTVSLITCNEDRAWHPDELRALFASYAPEPTVMSHHAGGGDIEAQEGAWDLLPRPCRYAYRNARSIGDDSEGFWRFVCTCAEYGVPEGVALGAAIKGRDEGAFPKRYSDAHLSGQIRKAYTKVEAEGKLGSKSTPAQREQKKKGPPDRRTNDQVAPTTSDDALEDIAVDHNTMVDTNVALAEEFDIDPAILRMAKSRAVSSSFILSAPKVVPALWGRDGEEVWWSPNEGLMLNAATGAGKTTLAGLLIRARMGYADEVAGLPIVAGKGKVLYLAMDRPAQVQRSLRRQLGNLTEEQIEHGLVVLQGPPIASFVANQKLLLAYARTFDADTVIVDSLKDAVVKLSDEEAGGSWNRAVQHCNAGGVEVIVLHHYRKVSGDSRDKPRTIDDVYGSNWLTAGVGSVVFMSRDCERVELSQLKGPAGDGNRMSLMLEFETGELLTEEQQKSETKSVEEMAWEYLNDHPDASKRQLRKAVPGSNDKKDRVFEEFHTAPGETDDLLREEL